jgi:mono/diheme cytochrome c family protein
MRLALLLAALPLYSATVPPNHDAFETRVRPVLARACFGCHTDTAMGGLKMDSREHILKDVVPGDPDASKLIQAIRYNTARKMPPSGKLKPEEIADIEAWVKAGAVWPAGAPKTLPYVITPEQRNFWSFRSVSDPPVPAVQNKKWPKTKMDHFILSKLEAAKLQPVARADKRTLIRRASFDLTGIPPTPEEVAAFEADQSPDAFGKVVDRLLASPRYGERWGRYWLDVARYSDGKLSPEREEPYPAAFRYRDWVIEAFNKDMPYDKFVEAQIAGDLMPEPEKYRAGLGFYSISPEFTDDRVDATTRGFLAMTAACAQCHDHKFDPIPTRDYYSLLGIFNNTSLHETPLVSKEEVARWQERKKRVDDAEKELKGFVDSQSDQLAEILAAQASKYLMAAAGGGPRNDLDKDTIDLWTAYLKRPKLEHPFLKDWTVTHDRAAADAFQALLLKVVAEKKTVDDKNHITLGLNPNRGDLSNANLVSMDRDRFVLWEDFFGPKGVLHYPDGKIDRFLAGQWKQHLDTLRAQLAAAKKDLPAQYAFLQTIEDAPKWKEQRVWLRGSRENPGDPAPPHFLQILSKSEPARFEAKPRLELAEHIASKENPLTARVMVNRIWQHHFGQGIVRTPSDFGAQGDRPSHPELLDYLASRFMSEGWSMKKLHREIMLSEVYQLSSVNAPKNFEQDPENRLLWRFNRHRLDVEGLRDSLLYVSGSLDPKAGGPPEKFGPDNFRRTVYCYVSRYKIDSVLGLFDFPNPVGTSEQRSETNVPLQRLFFMNSDFMASMSRQLAARMDGATDAARVAWLYEAVYQRKPSVEETKLAVDFVRDSNHAWSQYAQVLLSSNEFEFVN